MYKKITQAALLLALATVFLWLTFTVFLPISLPFLLGIGLALLAEPAVVLLAQKFHWKRAAATAAGVSAVPFLFAVTVAASMCFASPFSTPPNALVMSAGSYKTIDYIKVGLPLQIVMAIVMIIALPMIFPF